MLITVGLFVSNAGADFVTQFDTSEGFNYGSTIVGVDNWTLGAGNNARVVANTNVTPIDSGLVGDIREINLLGNSGTEKFYIDSISVMTTLPPSGTLIVIK